MLSTVTARKAFSGAGALALSAAVLLGACGKGESLGTEGPNLPGNPGENPTFRQASFVFDVNTARKTVRITAPTGEVINASLEGGEDGPSYSILTGDVVELTTSNFFASAVGQFTPGKVRVRFDVNITNRIPSIDLITPTFPTPPAGVAGVLLFPFSTTVTTTTGGTSTGGDGTEVIVELPNRGEVDASIDWDGAPFNFFNDDGCAAGSNDCYRYEAFGQPLLGGATSEALTVGFDIDPTVSNFRARLIVAADIRAGGPPAVGSIAGTVTSNLGPISGAAITVSGGFSGTTDATGAYSIANVNIGPRTVSVAGLPAGCSTVAPQAITVANGATSTVNFTTTCPVPSFTLTGTLTRTGGAAISGASIVITPDGGAALPAIATNAAGVFTASVPVGSGSGTYTIGNLPAGCTAPGTQSYSGAAVGATITQNLTITCPVPGPNAANGTWSFVNGEARLLISVNVTSGNIGTIGGTFAPHPRLTYLGGLAPSEPQIGNSTSGPAGQNPVIFGAFTTEAAGLVGVQNVRILRFQVLPGPAETVAGGTLVLTDLVNNLFNDISSTFSGNINVAQVALPAVP